MNLEGKLLIGQQAISGRGADIQAVNPATGEMLAPTYPGGSKTEVDQEPK